MFCRSVSWFICIFVAVLTAADYSDSHPSTESPTAGQVQEGKEAAAVDLGTLLDAGDSAVVTLVAGDTRLAAHRAVLAVRSPVFASIFSHGTLEATVPDVGGQLLRHLVAYMYTLQATQLARMAPQLLVAAHKYGLSGLKAQCEQQLASQLSIETAVTTAVLAIRNSCSTLEKTAATFIKTHILHVMATKGWADALHCQPEDLIEVLKLLSQPPAETSTPATGDSEVTPTSQLHMGHKKCSRAPVPAAKHTATCPTPTFDDVSVSFLRHYNCISQNEPEQHHWMNGVCKRRRFSLPRELNMRSSGSSSWNSFVSNIRLNETGSHTCSREDPLCSGERQEADQSS
ncbi:uncharacterized protein LOC126426910 isoform X2 [Schistocerca serialis cubense]|uniref:uncharacterized protein LOC126426910 isoform X2 n=1 Tax=Schistocerca serialis cubense TaxID=2023355 RepID=UPI00214EAF03|nr:uncharacterized protein LOC126426910 isoform X2 [Schistocerca serialis cubense]